MRKIDKSGIKGCIGVLLIAVLALSSACAYQAEGREVIQVGNKKITVLNTKKSPGTEKTAVSNGFDVGKIERYEGVRGEGWLSEETILITKVNRELEPIRVFDQMSQIRNLSAYDLTSHAEKSLSEKTAYIWAPIVSPDGKHIFFEKYEAGVYTGIISNLEGEEKASVQTDPANGFSLSFNQAVWVDNGEVLIPSSNEGVCLVNVNSNVSKIEGIGLMQTDRAARVDHTIYYVSTERNLVAYDMLSRQTQVVKEKVLDFQLSPQKEMFALQKKVSGNKVALVITDLAGNEKATLAEANQVFGVSWSPDQSMLAYLMITDDESKNGLHIINMTSREDIYVSRDFLNVDNGLKWSPSGRKILASIGEVKEMTLIDNTYVFSLK